MPEPNRFQICGQNQYDEINQSCVSCEEQCDRCIDNICFKCSIGYNHISNQCLKTTDQACTSTYFLNNNSKQCQKCDIPGCERCISMGICEQCQTGYEINPITNQCIMSLLVQESQLNFYKSINIYGENKIILNCPLLYQEIKDNKTCKKMKFCSNSMGNVDNSYQEEIKQIEINEDNSYLLVISAYKITIYDRQTYQYLSLLINLNNLQSNQPNDNSNSNHEYIHNIIQIKNIIITFTNKRVLSYELESKQILSNLDFNQGSYTFKQNDRFLVEKLSKQILYVHMDQANTKLQLSQFQFTSNEINGKIDADTFQINLYQTHTINLFDMMFMQINLSLQMKAIFISTNTNFMIVLIDILLENQAKKESKDYLISKQNGLEYSNVYDQVYSNELNAFYHLRSSNSNYLYSKITFRKEQMQIDILQQIYTFTNNYSLVRLIMLKQVSINSLRDIYLLSLSTTLDNNQNIISQQLVLKSLESNTEQSYSINTNNLINYIPQQMSYYQDLLTNSIYFSVNSKSTFSIFKLMNNEFYQQIKQQIEPFYQYDLLLEQSSNVIVQNDSQQETSFYDIIIPQYTNFNCFRISQQDIRVIRQSQQIIQGLQDVYSLPQFYSTQLAYEQKTIYEKYRNYLIILDYYKNIRTIFVSKINLERRQIESQDFLYLTFICSENCFGDGAADSQKNLIFFELRNDDHSECYIFNFSTLKLANVYKYDHSLGFKYPYFIILKILRLTMSGPDTIQILEINSSQSLTNLLEINSSFENSFYNLRISPNSACFVFYQAKTSPNFEQIIFCNSIEFNKAGRQTIPNIYQVDFLNDTDFIVIYEQTSKYKLKVFRINLATNILSTLKSFTFTPSTGPLGFGQPYDYIESNQLLIINDKMKLYVRVRVESNYFNGLLEIFDLNTYKNIQSLPTILIDIDQPNYDWESDMIFDYSTLSIILVYRQKDLGNFSKIYVDIQQYQFNTVSKLFNVPSHMYTSSYSTTTYSFGQKERYVYSPNQKFISFFTINQLFLGMTISRFNSLTQSSPMIIPEINHLYFNDGKKTIMAQNIPNLANSKISSYENKRESNKWWISDQFSILILVRSLPEQQEYTQKTIQFLFIDTFEEAMSKLDIAVKGQVFWFEKLGLLIVCQQNKINHYRISNSQLIQIDSYELDLQVDFENDLNYCMQTQIHPFILCSNIGVYNIITKKLDLLNNFTIQRKTEKPFQPIFHENEKYIIIEPLVVYSISEGLLIDVVESGINQISNIQISFTIPNEVFYQKAIDHCIIFSLPNFEIVKEFINQEKVLREGDYICQFQADSQVLVEYKNKTLNSYKYAQKWNSDQDVISSIIIEESYLSYFNTHLKVLGEFVVGQILKTVNVNDSYRGFLLIHTTNGDIQEINGYTTQSSFSNLIQIWSEKKLLFTNEQLISISDVSISLNLNGATNDVQTQSMKVSKNYNYIIYETSDNQKLAQLDISEFFPLTINNSQLKVRYNIDSIKFYKSHQISNVLSFDEMVNGELFYFDLKQFFIKTMKYTIKSSQVDSKQQIQQTISQATISNLQDLFNINSNQNNISLNPDTPYQLYLVYEDPTLQIFALIYQCQLLFISNSSQNNTLKVIDLSNYQCRVHLLSQSYSKNSQQLVIEQQNSNTTQQILLIKNQSIIEKVDIMNNVVTTSIIYEESIASKKIKDVIMIKSGTVEYTCIIYSNVLNKFMLIRYQSPNKVQKLLSESSSSSLNSILLLSYKTKDYILLGTNNYLIIYLINSISSTDFSLVQTNKLFTGKRGEIFFILQLKSSILQLLITTSRRTMLLQDSSAQNSNQIDMALRREAIMHTRSHHKIKIMNEGQYIAIISQIQVSIYSGKSLQFVGRIEEESSQQIRDVFSTPMSNLIFICDYEYINIFDLRVYNEEGKLTLLKQFSQQLPQIFQLIHSKQINSQNLQEEFMIINGSTLNGAFSIKYNIDENQTLNGLSEEGCINNINLPSTKIQQQRLYQNLIQNSQENGHETLPIYIQLDHSMDLYIPTNIIDLTENTSYKKLDIQINLMEFKGYISSHSFITEKSFISSLKIFNGQLVLTQDMFLFQMENLELDNVQIIFSPQGFKLTIMFISHIILKNVRFLDDEISNDLRFNQFQQSQKLTEQPLVYIYNSTNVYFQQLQLQNIKIERDLFNFQNLQKVQIEKVEVKQSNVVGTLFQFSNQNQIIEISDIQMENSYILQAFYVHNSNRLSIQNLKFNKVNNNLSSRSFLRALVEKNQENIGSQEYDSFIFIRLVFQSTQIDTINISNKCSFIIFLNYSYQYSLDGILKKVLNSQIKLNSFNVDDSNFLIKMINIEETLADLTSFILLNSQNPIIKVSNSYRGLDLSNFTLQKNEFINKGMIIIENCVVKIDQFKLFTNNLQKISTYLNIRLQKDEIYLIEIVSSLFYINSILADNNTSPNYFMKIFGTFNNHQDQTSSQNTQNLIPLSKHYFISDLQIFRSSYGALLIQNAQIMTLHSSALNNNNILKQNERGGAIYIKNTILINIIGTQIKDNYSKLYGGGVYMEESDATIIDSHIHDNQALIGGGLRYINLQQQPLNLLKSPLRQCIYDNKAPIFGSNFGSIPTQLVFLSDLDNWVSSINQYSVSLVFQVYGEDGEVADFEHPSISERNLSDESLDELQKYKNYYLFTIDNNVLIEKQTRSYDILKKSFNITSYITSKGYSELITLQSKPQVEQEQLRKISSRRILQIRSAWNIIPKKDFTISFRDCQQGEIILQLQQDSYECHLCDDNTYSLTSPYQDIEQTKCNECPLEASYCKGNLIIPREEYWVDPGTDFIAYCENMPSKCTQYLSESENYQIQDREERSQTNGCSEGGFGPLCQSCDYENKYWNKNKNVLYAKKNRYECYKCDNMAENIQNYILPIILIIIFLIFVTYQLFQNVFVHLIHLRALLLKKIQLIFISNSLYSQDKSSAVIKIIITYIQIVSVITHFRLQIPDFLEQIFFFFGNILDISFYFLDCFFVKTGLSLSIKMVYLRLIWTFVSTLIYLFFLAFLGYYILKKVKLLKWKKNIMISGYLQLFYLIFPSLISQTIGTICCKSINKKSYILIDIQFECYEHDYYKFNLLISLPLLLITLLIPLFIFLKLRGQQNNLTRVHTYLNYGFFFADYKNSRYYWELVRIYQKIILFCAIAIFNQSNIIAGLVIAISIIFYIKFQQTSQPYKLNFFNQLDQLSQVAAVLTIFGTIINTQSDSKELQYTFLAIVVIVNVIFFSKALFYLSLMTFFRKIYFKISTLSKFFQKQYLKVSSSSLLKKNNIIRLSKYWRQVKDFMKSQRTLKFRTIIETKHDQQTSETERDFIITSLNGIVMTKDNLISETNINNQKQKSLQLQQILETSKSHIHRQTSTSTINEEESISENNQQVHVYGTKPTKSKVTLLNIE